MNTVEDRVKVLGLNEETSNLTRSSNITDELTTVLPETTLDVNSSLTEPNMTVIGTMVKTALAITNLTRLGDDGEIDHPYFIYIWGVFIFGCIVLTTGR